MGKEDYAKIHLVSGVCKVGFQKGKRSMPKITPISQVQASNSSNIDEDKMLRLAKEMAREMAIEMAKNMPQQQVIIQQGGVAKSEKCDSIEIESGFIDPTESEKFSVNLDNIKSKTGDSIKDKLAKLKQLKGDL